MAQISSNLLVKEYQEWKKKKLSQEQADAIRDTMRWLLVPCMFFVTEYCKRPTPITTMEMGTNILENKLF